MNRVIQHWLDGAADDLFVKTEEAVDWSSMPSSPANLRESAQNTFLPLSRQTIFKQQLSLEFQEREWMES